MVYLNDILVALIAVTAIIAVYAKWTLVYWRRKGVKTPDASFPFGNVGDMLWQRRSLAVIVKDVYSAFKIKGLKYCGFYFLTRPTLVLFDLELIKQILTNDFPHFTGNGSYVNETVDPLTGNLLFLDGSSWKKMRTKLTPTFTSGKIKMMFQTLLACSDELIVILNNSINKRQAVDIKDVVGRYTTDVIGSCAFGVECNSLKNPDSEFVTYGRRALFRTPLSAFKLLLSICSPKLMRFFKLTLFETDVIEFFTNFVRQTVSYREESQVLRNDFMHLLIQLKNNVKIDDDDESSQLKSRKTKTTLTTEEITAQAFIFFLAGFETSSTTLTFCLYELALNLQIQEKLRNEISTTLKTCNEELTYDALTQMTYMDKCINETLRKYPPIPLLIRECNKSYPVPESDLVVDEGTKIFIPVLAIHHDSEYYPDPEKFDPERFSTEGKSQRPHYAWLPFGEGPRACIGLRFARMQTKACLAVLLRNYKFSLNSKTQTPLPIDPKPFALVALGEVWLNVEKV